MTGDSLPSRQAGPPSGDGPHEPVSEQTPVAVAWQADAAGWLQLLDQTRLPGEVVDLACRTPLDVAQAIQRLAVRGAPAIGIAAAYGFVLGAQQVTDHPREGQRAHLIEVGAMLAASRPTAVNLFWALDRMGRLADAVLRDSAPTGQRDLAAILLREAREIHDEDRRLCHRIGAFGAPLLSGCRHVLTHCNAGGLATSELGTALAVIRMAHRNTPHLHVWVDETRPLLQGARLTAWELQQAGVPCTLITDSMAAAVMAEGRVDAVIVGADRIAANGDTANKIGTYSLARLAEAHGIPFYVAAPHSTFDLALSGGQGIPIEVRAAEEVTNCGGRTIAPQGVAVYNPAFDVTPAKFITVIITDRGLIQPPNRESIAAIVGARTAAT
jgi:methylthioribose-1-phosphate isomerase